MAKTKHTTDEIEQMYASGRVPPASGQAVITDAAPRPRKRHRVFMWVFLGIQAIFIIWLVSAAVTSTGASHADIVSTCGHGQWQGLWKSYSDCAAHSGVVAAHDVGKSIAVGLIVLIWFLVDFFVGLTYGIYRLARRPR